MCNQIPHASGSGCFCGGGNSPLLLLVPNIQKRLANRHKTNVVELLRTRQINGRACTQMLKSFGHLAPPSLCSDCSRAASAQEQRRPSLAQWIDTSSGGFGPASPNIPGRQVVERAGPGRQHDRDMKREYGNNEPLAGPVMKRESDYGESEAKREVGSGNGERDAKREADSGDEREAKRARITRTPDDFDRHAITHRDKDCDKCVYQWNRVAWEAVARLPGGVGTWLQPQPVDDDEWWLGCSICSKGTALGRIRKLRGSSMHLGNIRSHGRSLSHVRACAASASNHPIEAPPASEFNAAWKDAALGHKAANGSKSLRKTTSLEWCIAQRIQDGEREFLKQAETIAVLLDERNCRMLIKFQACDRNLSVRFGVLGLLRNAGKTAPQIAAAVHDAVRALCTSREPHPSMNCLKSHMPATGTVDEALAANIMQRIIFYVSDGDAATHLAGHMLHQRSERSALVEKMPNLRVVIRDRAHSSRHLNEHSFAADPVLQMLLQTAVLRPHSIARQLKDSQPLRAIFVAEAQNQLNRDDLIATVTDMSFAAQRFDSLQKPLGRIVLNLEALLSYCLIVIRERGHASEEGQGCMGFVQAMTEVNVILLGMMADAADECMILTRFLDKDTFDVGAMRVELEQFNNRVNDLFLHKTCLKSGYTQVALDFLKHPRVLQVPGQALRTLGSKSGVDEQNVLLALARMVNWVTLTQRISSTEFPENDALSALDVFFLTAAAKPRRMTDKDRQALNTVAKVFHLDAVDLVAQFEDHLPVADHEKRRDPTLNSTQAWATAIKRTQKTDRSRKKYPVEALRRALSIHAIGTGSTSGIERNFGAAKRNIGDHWNGTALAEQRRMVVALAYASIPESERPALITGARLIWAECFGVPRTSPINRLHSRRKNQEKSHAAFLRRRRTAGKTTKVVAPADPRLAELAESLWTEKHDKEVARQQKVQETRARQAALEGLVVDDTEELQALIADERDAQRRRQKKLDADHKRIENIRNSPVLVDLNGKTVWVDSAVATVMRESNIQWWARMSLRVVDRRELAHILVVSDAAAPGGRNQVVAHLRGCLVTTPDYFLAPPSPVLQWKAALAQPRIVFFSDMVNAAHKSMVEVIIATAGAWTGLVQASRWQIFVGANEWPQYQTFVGRRNRKNQLRTIVHTSERQHPNFQNMPAVMNLHEFLETLGQLETNSSMMGMCNR